MPPNHSSTFPMATRAVLLKELNLDTSRKCLFLSKNGELFSENRKVVSRNFLIELFRREEDIVLVIHVEVAVTFGNEPTSTRTNGATELTMAMTILLHDTHRYSSRDTQKQSSKQEDNEQDRGDEVRKTVARVEGYLKNPVLGSAPSTGSWVGAPAIDPTSLPPGAGT